MSTIRTRDGTGMVANTCVEATARCGAEHGYHVILVRDATDRSTLIPPTGSSPLQVRRVETLGKATVDGSQNFARLGSSMLISP